MFIIVNKRERPQHQFGTFDSHSDAYRVLRKAIEKLPPHSGLHVKEIKEGEGVE